MPHSDRVTIMQLVAQGGLSVEEAIAAVKPSGGGSSSSSSGGIFGALSAELGRGARAVMRPSGGSGSSFPGQSSSSSSNAGASLAALSPSASAEVEDAVQQAFALASAAVSGSPGESSSGARRFPRSPDDAADSLMRAMLGDSSRMMSAEVGDMLEQARIAGAAGGGSGPGGGGSGPSESQIDAVQSALASMASNVEASMPGLFMDGSIDDDTDDDEPDLVGPVGNSAEDNEGEEDGAEEREDEQGGPEAVLAGALGAVADQMAGGDQAALFAPQLAQLAEMGFTDEDQLLPLLVRHGGQVERVMGSLF